jgi:hypothetical protein
MTPQRRVQRETLGSQVKIVLEVFKLVFMLLLLDSIWTIRRCHKGLVVRLGEAKVIKGDSLLELMLGNKERTVILILVYFEEIRVTDD